MFSFEELLSTLLESHTAVATRSRSALEPNCCVGGQGTGGHQLRKAPPGLSSAIYVVKHP